MLWLGLGGQDTSILLSLSLGASCLHATRALTLSCSRDELGGGS